MVEAIRQGDVPGIQLRCRQRLEVPAEVAWRWLSEVERLEGWIAEGVAGDFGEGGSVLLSCRDENGRLLEEQVEVVEFRPPKGYILHLKQLNERWNVATKVSFELLPGESDCEVSVFHEGFEYLSLSDCLTFWEFYRRRWRVALVLLEAAVRA